MNTVTRQRHVWKALTCARCGIMKATGRSYVAYYAPNGTSLGNHAPPCVEPPAAAAPCPKCRQTDCCRCAERPALTPSEVPQPPYVPCPECGGRRSSHYAACSRKAGA